MKKIILLLVSICMVSTSYAWPWDKKINTQINVKENAVKAATQPIGTPLQQAKELIKELNTELNSAKSENSRLKNNLFNATEKLKDAELKTQEVQKQADALKAWGIKKEQEAIKWFDSYNNAIKRYHKLKAIAAVIAAAGGVLLGLQFMNFVPPPYNLLVPIGGAGIFGALVWIFL